MVIFAFQPFGNKPLSIFHVSEDGLTHTRGLAAGMRPRYARGFTLIEILVVMAVVALLLTLASPSYFGSIEKSKEVVLIENLQALRAGIDKYYADKGQYPETLEDLVTQKYFRSVPVDPFTESNRSWILIPSSDVDVSGIEDVKSGAQGKTRDGILYEQL